MGGLSQQNIGDMGEHKGPLKSWEVMRGLGEYRRCEGAQPLVWGGVMKGGTQPSPYPHASCSPHPISFLIFLMLILPGKCFSITGTTKDMGRWLGGTGAAVGHYETVRGPYRAFVGGGVE